MLVHKYAKFVVAAVAAIAASLLTVLGDDAVTTQEIIEVIILIAGALGVARVENKRTDNGSSQFGSSSIRS
jgi:hypothetical protein